MTESAFRTIRISDPRFERDRLRLVTVKSEALKGRGDISLYVPTPCPLEVPLVILLHGVYGSHWSWSMGGGAHLTAERLIQSGEIRPMAIAMPSDGLWGDGSGYLPHRLRNYERWIVHEVPAAVAEVVETINPSSTRFIAGLSMGGFGALRLGGKYAEKFSGISAHSAITHFEQMAAFVEEPLSDYGDQSKDLCAAAPLIEKKKNLPPVRFDCGLSDPLLTHNRALHDRLEKNLVPHTYEEFPGNHSWPYWEEHLEKTLRFFDRLIK